MKHRAKYIWTYAQTVFDKNKTTYADQRTD